MIFKLTLTVLVCALCACAGNNEGGTMRFENILNHGPSITGKSEYLKSPFVTAGDLLYLVGYQDGSFPEIGWHIQGEMGGIWDHPIKLMDGIGFDLVWPDDSIPLIDAQTFVNYPMANKHVFNLPQKDLRIERWQFVPDHLEGVSIQLVIENLSQKPQQFKLNFRGDVDLRPTWLGEKTNMLDHPDELFYQSNLDAWVGKDEANPWFVVYGGETGSTSHSLVESSQAGHGKSSSQSYQVSLEAQGTSVLNFTVAGSYHSQEQAVATFEVIQQNWYTLLEQKSDRYHSLANMSRLTIPNKQMEQTFEWLKYNCDWLVRNVPEIGTGIMAGIPDYPWWFGVDSEYALKGYMAIGREDVVRSTIKLLDSISNAVNGNGKILHEVSTNGAVFNPGNINETPQFASLIWEVYRWNGDRQFLEKYFPTIKRGLAWLLDENDSDDNLFPEGFGMMEIHGLNSEMIDVASYTQRAFADAAKMAEELGEEELASKYLEISLDLNRKINEEFWSGPFESYADFIGTDQQALKLIDEAIVRADTLNKPWAVDELENTKVTIMKDPSAKPRPFVTHHNWVVNTPMEMNIADSAKAHKALETASKFVNPFGVFVTGIDRDESAGADEGSFEGSKVFSYTGAVMTLPTGVQVVAENNYGRPDKALDYLERMTRSFSYALPGSMYEVSPDYGMMAQAWNIYAFAVPIVQQFFGLEPYAAKKQIIIRPTMPASWYEASLENVQVSENEVDIFYKRTDDHLWMKVSQTKLDWTLKVVIPQDKPVIEINQGVIDQANQYVVVADTNGVLEFRASAQ